MATQRVKGVINGVGCGGQADAPCAAMGGKELAARRVERVGERCLCRGSRRGLELHQRQLQLDARTGGQVVHLEHLDQALELGQHLAKVPIVAPDRDRHPGLARLMGGADGQGLDVEAPRPQQAGHAIERPGSIDHEGADHVPALNGIGLSRRQGLASRRGDTHSDAPSTMSDRPLPGSIIGYTFCASSRWKSMSAGPGALRASAMTGATSSGRVARQAGMP